MEEQRACELWRVWACVHLCSEALIAHGPMHNQVCEPKMKTRQQTRSQCTFVGIAIEAGVSAQHGLHTPSSTHP